MLVTAVDRPDNGLDELVWVQLPADDIAFVRGFDPDRDRTASRADMVRVVEHLQAALLAHTDGPPATCSDRHVDPDRALTMWCEQIPGHVGPHVNHRAYW